MIPTDKRIETVKTVTDLALYVEELRESLLSTPDKWENLTLESYLESMSAWLVALDKQVDLGLDDTHLTESLQIFAHILVAASIYE